MPSVDEIGSGWYPETNADGQIARSKQEHPSLRGNWPYGEYTLVAMSASTLIRTFLDTVRILEISFCVKHSFCASFYHLQNYGPVCSQYLSRYFDWG